MKKCTECRSPVTKTLRESYHYDACGLSNVVLRGIPVYVCSKCKTEFVSIPNMQGLHDTLAAAIVGKAGGITADEVRFLRTWLGCDNGEFAALMGVSVGTSSRWASGEKPISSTAENLLRTIVALKGAAGFEVATLAKIDRDLPLTPYSISRRGNSWGQSESAKA